MATLTRGVEETNIADSTSLTSAGLSFTWDLTAAWYGEITLEVTFPSSSYTDVTVYACPTAVSSPVSADYPLGAQGRQIGVIPGTASTTVAVTMYVGQSDLTIRLAYSGASAATVAKCRGRKYT